MNVSSQYVVSTYGGMPDVIGGGGESAQLMGVSSNFPAAVTGGGATVSQPLGIAANVTATANAAASVSTIPSTTVTVPGNGLQPGASTVTGGGGSVQPTAPVADPHAGHTATPPAQSSNPVPTGPPTQGSSTPTSPAPTAPPAGSAPAAQTAPAAPPANEDPLDALKRELSKATTDDAKKALYDKYVAKATTDAAKKELFLAYYNSVSAAARTQLDNFFLVVELRENLATAPSDDIKNQLFASARDRTRDDATVKLLFSSWYASLSATGKTNADRMFGKQA